MSTVAVVASALDGTQTHIPPDAKILLTCEEFPLDDPQQGKCGWYLTQPGDMMHSQAYTNAWGEAQNFVPAPVGEWHLAYNQVITHTVALPCDDPRVAWGVERYDNVYCDIGGMLVRFKADRKALSPLHLMMVHDLIVRRVRDTGGK